MVITIDTLLILLILLLLAYCAINDSMVRCRYKSDVDTLYMKYKPVIEKSQGTTRPLVKQISSERMKIRDMHQSNTSPVGRLYIAFYNLAHYGTFSNPTFESLEKKQSLDRILQSSFKTAK
jgi:hypothetical protein